MAAKRASRKARTPPWHSYPAWSTAKFNSFIRSALRSASRRWPPKWEKKEEGKRPYTGPNKRQKFEYHCEACDGWFPGQQVEMDHIVEAGGFTNLDELGLFVDRLLCAKEGWQRLCRDCHRKKTLSYNEERRKLLRES